MTDIAPSTRLLTVPEYAAMQGWSQDVVRYRVRMFNFPHVRQGRRILIPENAAELELARQREER